MAGAAAQTGEAVSRSAQVSQANLEASKDAAKDAVPPKPDDDGGDSGVGSAS
jgi:hypothetical protein